MTFRRGFVHDRRMSTFDYTSGFPIGDFSIFTAARGMGKTMMTYQVLKERLGHKESKVMGYRQAYTELIKLKRTDKSRQHSLKKINANQWVVTSEPQLMTFYDKSTGTLHFDLEAGI